MVTMVSRVWKTLLTSVCVTACFWSLQIRAFRGGCQFHNSSSHLVLDTEAHCSFTYPYNDNCSSSLRLTVDGGFRGDAVCLDKFNSTELTLSTCDKRCGCISKEMYREPVSDLGIYYNLSSWWQHPLALLEKLEIHIPLCRIDSALFKGMGQLRHLNLSHTLGLATSTINQILQSLSNAGSPLECLDLSWSHCHQKVSCDTLNIREDVLGYLQAFPLKFLDIRGIEAVEFDVGFAEFTPGLETLHIGYYQTPRRTSWDVESCLWLDISILPNITKITFDLGSFNRNPGNVNLSCPAPWHEPDLPVMFSRPDRTGNVTVNCSNLVGESPCILNNCECHRKINNYPLLRKFTENLRSNFSTVYENDQMYSKVYSFPPFPVPPHLRYLSVSSSALADWEWSTTVEQRDTELSHLIYRVYRHFDAQNNSEKINLVSRLKNLTYLDLQSDIAKIDHDFTICKDAPNLEVLHLGSINFHISWSHFNMAFGGNPNLRVLNITECICDLPDITKLTKLEYLDLRHNNLWELSTITTTFLDSLQKQRNVSVDLSQNPLSCYCDSQEFFSWMRSTKVVFLRKSEMKCRHPVMGQVSPWDIDQVEFRRHCSNFRLILTTTVTVSVSICFVLILVLIFRKRWTIRYWLHAARASWNQKQCSNTSYRFDAFVAYCTQDVEERKWVHLTLTPKLEQEYGFKLCLHHRNFMPGYDIADNIVQAIEHSNKVLVILSPTFLKSDWCQFEVRMARQKLIRDRRDSVIMVIYKPLDVSGVRLPRKLIQILERKTYVEWTMDTVGQDLFWKKLTKALRNEIYHEPFDIELVNATSSHNEQDIIQDCQVLIA